MSSVVIVVGLPMQFSLIITSPLGSTYNYTCVYNSLSMMSIQRIMVKLKACPYPSRLGTALISVLLQE